jgi:hypothetical protein
MGKYLPSKKDLKANDRFVQKQADQSRRKQTATKPSRKSPPAVIPSKA